MGTNQELVTPTSLPIPADRVNNFWYGPHQSDVVIVFLHGIFSSSRSCWLNAGGRGKPSVFWPDLVRTDRRLGSPAIYLAGYYTAIEAGDFGLAQCAGEVLDGLAEPDSDGSAPVLDASSIIFVCHSTGGIVARYLLERNKEKFRDKAVGLALIASPSLGSNWASLGSGAARYYNQHLGMQLKPNNEVLRDIDGRFRDLVANRATTMPGLFGMEAAENKMVYRDSVPALFRWMLPNRLRVVTSLSAGQYFGEVQLLPNTDHFSTVKPDGPEHPAHKFLVKFVSRFREPSSAPQRHLAEVQARRNAAQATTGTVEPAPQPPVNPAPGTTPLVALVSNPAAPLQIQQLLIALPGAAPLGVPSVDLVRAQAPVKPRLDELFEIITNPDDVVRALFRTDRAGDLAPYDIEYVNARTGTTDFREALKLALRENRNRLLVTGLRGVGKTREVAEVARKFCEAHWTILVPRDEADRRRGLPDELPAHLAEARVLLVVDNLHARFTDDVEQRTSYLERLEQLIDWLQRRLSDGLTVVATARDESRFQGRLGGPRDVRRWRGFGLLSVPALTDDGLRQMLIAAAARARVTLNAEHAIKLIENSDRKPETVVINVDLARGSGMALTQGNWRPTEGESWAQRFASARADDSAVDRVCQALQLLHECCVAARVAYVKFIGRSEGAADVDSTVAMLVGNGLLRMRQDIVTPFSSDQLTELVGALAVPAMDPLSHVDVVQAAITDPASRQAEWLDDLLALSSALDDIGEWDHAERVATRAIELGGGVRGFRARVAARFHQGKLREAESDLTFALQINTEDRDLRMVRGLIRHLLADLKGALEDFDDVIEHGRDDAAVHVQRGGVLFQLEKWSAAIDALGAAIDRGDDQRSTYVMRGLSHTQLTEPKELEAAERDFSAALERGTTRAEGESRVDEGAHHPRKPPAFLSADMSSADAWGSDQMIFALRGITRLKRDNSVDAEADLSRALDGSLDGLINRLSRSVDDTNVPLLLRAKDQLAKVKAGLGDTRFFAVRGFARLNQGKWESAESDFDRAITLGIMDADTHLGRGWARLQLQRFPEAGADADEAMRQGRRDGSAYALRGLARHALEQLDGAEADLTKAIDLGNAIPRVLFSRGVIRTARQRFTEAEADFDVLLSQMPNGRAFFWRGCVRFQLQKYREAEQDLTSAKDLGCDDEALEPWRGLARLSQGNLEGADEDAEAAFTRGTRTAVSHSLFGAVRGSHQRFDEAVQELTAAIALGRDDAWVYATRGQARLHLQHYADSEADFSAALRRSTDAESLVGRGLARLARGNATDAAEDFSAAIKSGRDEALVHALLGNAWKAANKLEDAEAEYTSAIALDDQPSFRRERGLARLVLGDFSGADSDLTNAITAFPDDARMSYGRGVARSGLCDYTGALADLDTAVARAPNDLSYVRSRVVVNLRLGDADMAAQDVARLEAIDSTSMETLSAKGFLQLARGDVEAAVSTFSAVVEKNPDSYYDLGLAYLVTGRVDDARKAYSTATARSIRADRLIAIQELDWHLAQLKGGRVSREIETVASEIRADLARPAGSQAQAGPGDAAIAGPSS